jgi:plasmid stabilization system protein ParE
VKEVTLTEEAQLDIRRIEDYIQNNYSVPNTVEEFRKNLRQVMQNISMQPEIGVAYNQNVRKWVSNHYIHLYVEYADGISVLQIAYEKTDWIKK